MTKKLQIKGDIVDDETVTFYNFFGMPAVSPSKVNDVLNSDELDEDVEVNIASNGGDVFAASEIYTLLKSYRGKITVNIQGLAASAASVIAMAGDRVNISPTAQIMIHKAWSQSEGNADDLAHEAKILNGIDKSIAAAYQNKTSMGEADIMQLMSNETWLTAQQAVDKGFADEIMFIDSKKEQVINSASHIPDKAAVNKLLNLISKVEFKNREKSNDSQLSRSLKDRKLAILIGKRRL